MSVSRDLRDLPLFSGFQEADAKVFANFMDERECQDGEIIFDEKTATCSLYFVFTGRVSIFKTGQTSGSFLTILERNDLFGEVSFIDEKAPSASAKALGPTRLGIFSLDNFKTIEKENPALSNQFLLRLVRELSRRFRAVNEGADLKSSDQTIAELIASGTQVKISTTSLDYICKILYCDKNCANPLLKVDLKGFVILLPFGHIKSIGIPNREGKFL
jgi:CRP-like cAMP-binding protein